MLSRPAHNQERVAVLVRRGGDDALRRDRGACATKYGSAVADASPAPPARPAAARSRTGTAGPASSRPIANISGIATRKTTPFCQRALPEVAGTGQQASGDGNQEWDELTARDPRRWPARVVVYLRSPASRGRDDRTHHEPERHRERGAHRVARIPPANPRRRDGQRRRQRRERERAPQRHEIRRATQRPATSGAASTAAPRRWYQASHTSAPARAPA